MEAIYLLIPITLIIIIAAIATFFWAVRNDQFEDLEGPAYSILFDDQPGDISDENANNSPQINGKNIDE